MRVFVNSNPIDYADTNGSLSALLPLIEITSTKGIAIAVNNKVIPKTEWDRHTLCENDQLTVIKATQGG